ncbi:MAG: hypothetical protein ACT4N4_13120 [Rhodospirillales bacterium]
MSRLARLCDGVIIHADRCVLTKKRTIRWKERAMRKIRSQISVTLVGVLALLMLWAVALAGMVALPDGPGGAGVRVAEPTGLLISRQDMSGQTIFYRELRASAPASRPTAESSDGSC